jgi:shikimate kinase
MKPQRVIIVTGFMGCGKTEVAGRLALRLNRRLMDLDDLITQVEGRSPAQLIRAEGEPAFRLIETRVLSDLLKNDGVGVVSLGGGAWIETANRELIEKSDAVSVWLDTPFEVCWKRIADSAEDRPLGSTREEASARYYDRLPVYQLADISITTDGEDDPDVVAARIEQEIGAHDRAFHYEGGK